MSPAVLTSTLDTPLGRLNIFANDLGITAIVFDEQHELLPASNPLTTSPSLTVATLNPHIDTNTFVTHASVAPASKTASAHGAGTALQQAAAHRQQATAHLQQAAAQLQLYFAGRLQQFSLTLAPCGSAFQQQVWRALCTIPFANSCSYGAIAHYLDNPKAVRAVGAANGRNPIAIVVPCHRVIGANGRLTGYAGGLDRKLWLLQHELQHELQHQSSHRLA